MPLHHVEQHQRTVELKDDTLVGKVDFPKHEVHSTHGKMIIKEVTEVTSVHYRKGSKKAETKTVLTMPTAVVNPSTTPPPQITNVHSIPVHAVSPTYVESHPTYVSYPVYTPAAVQSVPVVVHSGYASTPVNTGS